MKFFHILPILLISFCINQIYAQDSQSLSKSLGVYVFPPDDKDKEAQEFDEFKCYQWAVEESGVDPIKGIEVKPDETAGTQPDGSAVKGAARGAALGAAIGAVTGDAGTGAAVGAISGGAGGLRGGRMRRGAQKQQAQQSAANQEKAMLESFKKAYSVCLEAKGYTVKI
jgi:hypothetical protein